MGYAVVILIKLNLKQKTLSWGLSSCCLIYFYVFSSNRNCYARHFYSFSPTKQNVLLQLCHMYHKFDCINYINKFKCYSNENRKLLAMSFSLVHRSRKIVIIAFTVIVLQCSRYNLWPPNNALFLELSILSRPQIWFIKLWLRHQNVNIVHSNCNNDL